MIEIEVSASSARLLHGEILTAGRGGLRVRLHTDASWEGLLTVAVIEGSRSADILVRDRSFTVPGECLSRAGDSLRIGLYGIGADGVIAIPTVWVNCGEIRQSVDIAEELEREDAQSVLVQILSRAAEALEAVTRLREDAENGLFATATGERGPAGACFIPSVTEDGLLSWSNEAGLPNPESIDLAAAIIHALDSGDGVSY